VSIATNERRLVYSVGRAARVSGVSRSELYRAISRGDLRARRLGSELRVLHGDLETYLEGLPVVEVSR
jgi:excisionase family DNA binding protein